jgi:hypothetical protein
MRAALEVLEAKPRDTVSLSLAWLAGQALEHDPEELRGALRRAELLLAAGGDPRRDLDLEGRAVTSLADDLDAPETRDRFEDALAALATDGEGLPSVAASLAELRAQPDRAWRLYAGALLAEELAGEDEA